MRNSEFVTHNSELMNKIFPFSVGRLAHKPPKTCPYLTERRGRRSLQELYFYSGIVGTALAAVRENTKFYGATCRGRCPHRHKNNAEFVMRNSELMTGFARTHYICFHGGTIRRERCPQRSAENSEFVMRNVEFRTGFAYDRLYIIKVGATPCGRPKSDNQ